MVFAFVVSTVRFIASVELQVARSSRVSVRY